MSEHRMGPPPHAEDPYTRLTSPRGVPVDQLVSVLQKDIRRGNVDNAVLAAYEMLTTSPEVAEHMWHRLKVIAVEDIGMGEPLAPVVLSSLYENYRAATGGEQTMMAVHAVRFLATAKKDRTSSEHTDLVMHQVESGEMIVSIPDYALCVHTKAGQEMGRGLLQWWENGAIVNNELETADHSYRNQLLDICRASEASLNVTDRLLHGDKMPGRPALALHPVTIIRSCSAPFPHKRRMPGRSDTAG